jgi:putative addiction module component (TIGR02574 family)
MTREVQELLQKALTLPDQERAELAGNLIASLDESVDPDVDSVWQQEVARRSAEVRNGEVTATSWEAVQKKARTLLDGE